MRLVSISHGTPFPFVCATCGGIRHTASSAQRDRARADLDGPAFATFHCGRCADDLKREFDRDMIDMEST